MLRRIICANQKEFDDLNAKIHAALQAADPTYNAERWSDKRINSKDGDIAIDIETRVEKYLTEGELARLVVLDKEEWGLTGSLSSSSSSSSA